MDYYERKEEFIELLRSRLDEKRFVHSLNVAESAAHLARKYGEDEKEAYIAGLLHDCTKKAVREEQLELCKHYGIVPDDIEAASEKLMHAKTGAAVAETEFGSLTV